MNVIALNIALEKWIYGSSLNITTWSPRAVFQEAVAICKIKYKVSRDILSKYIKAVLRMGKCRGS